VPVLLSTVAVNLEDCAPFASVHASESSTDRLSAWNGAFDEGTTNETARSFAAASAWYRRAAEIDPTFAELQFRMGNCNLELTNWIQAYKDFSLARDYDALDFRADTRINSVIQDAAARHGKDGVYLMDGAQIIVQNSPDGIPGLNFFYEHVHLNFAGNYLLALGLAEKIRGLLPASIQAHDQGDWASEDLCERRLALTVWDRLHIWQPIFERITMPPFIGQYCHAAFIRQCEAKRNQARIQMNSQTPEQAQQIYEQALAMAPDDYFLHVNYERFLEAGGHLAQAVEEAKRCCEIFPQLPGGFYYTGNLLVREGNIGEATDYFMRAVAIQSDYAKAQTALGEIFANQPNSLDAEHWFKRAIRSDPNYTEAYLGLGFFEQNRGNMAAAIVNYQKAADLEPDGPADYFNRANLAANSYHWDEAIADLQAVVKAKPEFWRAHYLLGIQLAAKGNQEEAERELSEAVRYRPDFAPAHLFLGISLTAQRKTTEALAEFHTVLQLDPANSSARQEIAAIEASVKSINNSNQPASPAGHTDN
jgi:tetratricopeptide (TPR) repeat protein